MKLLAHGLSAPRVHDLTPTDLVLDRVDGPTMGDGPVLLHLGLHPLRPVTRWLTGLGRRAFARVFLHRFTRGSVLAQLG